MRCKKFILWAAVAVAVAVAAAGAAAGAVAAAVAAANSETLLSAGNS